MFARGLLAAAILFVVKLNASGVFPTLNGNVIPVCAEKGNLALAGKELDRFGAAKRLASDITAEL